MAIANPQKFYLVAIAPDSKNIKTVSLLFLNAQVYPSFHSKAIAISRRSKHWVSFPKNHKELATKTIAHQPWNPSQRFRTEIQD